MTKQEELQTRTTTTDRAATEGGAKGKHGVTVAAQQAKGEDATSTEDTKATDCSGPNRSDNNDTGGGGGSKTGVGATLRARRDTNRGLD